MAVRRGMRPFMLACLVVVPAAMAVMGWIYQVDPAICNGCGRCIPHCDTGALRMAGGDAVIDPNLCNGCGDCVPWCIRGAIYRTWWTGIEDGSGDVIALELGPSPTYGPLLLSGGTPGADVTVVDLSGRVLVRTEVGSDGEVWMDLSGRPSGTLAVCHAGSPAGLVVLVGAI